MEIGIIGKPNSGKSSFFKAATLVDAKISNIPFTTIEPNVGIGFVSFDCVEKEFNLKCNPRKGFCKKGKRFIPIKIIDVAGLVPGAHLGKGMGNKFLDNLRMADCFIHVVDFSGLTDEFGNLTNNYKVENDIEWLERELDYWFLSIFEKIKKKISRIKEKEKIVEEIYKQFSGLNIQKNLIESCYEKVGLNDELKFLSELRKASKPMVIAANKIDLPSSQKNFEILKKIYELIPTSAEAEITLKIAESKNLIDYLPGNGFEIKASLNEAQIKALNFIRSLIEKFGSTGVQDCINKLIFEKLKLKVVYPVADHENLTDNYGNVLPDAFLVKPNEKLKDFAYSIHSEIAEKFVCGIDARTGKKLGKEYILKDGDVIKIVFSK